MRTLLAFKWPLLMCAIAAMIAAWLITSLLPGPSISLVIPDETSFQVTKPGRYTLWLEAAASTHAHSKLVIFSTTLPPGVSIAVTKPDGAAVPIQTEWPTSKNNSSVGTIQQAIGNIR